MGLGIVTDGGQERIVVDVGGFVAPANVTGGKVVSGSGTGGGALYQVIARMVGAWSGLGFLDGGLYLVLAL